MKTLKQICEEYGVRPREQEYVRLLMIELLTEKRREMVDKKPIDADSQAHHIIVMTNLIDEFLEELGDKTQ